MRRVSSRGSRRLVIGIIVGLTMLGGAAFAAILTRGDQSPKMPEASGAPGNYNSGHRVVSRGLMSAQAVAQVLADFAGTPVRNIIVRSPKLRDTAYTCQLNRQHCPLSLSLFLNHMN